MEPFLSHIKLTYTKYQIEVVILSIALIVLLGAVLLYFRNEKPGVSVIKISESSDSKVKATILVDIEGAVHKPDLYTIPENSNLKDLISTAGGLADDVDQYYFSRNFNLAATLHDQEKIYIPSIQESQSDSFSAIENSSSAHDSKINLNTASAKELDSLSGVGATSVEKIISARPFNSIEDLVSKKVLSKTVFEKIKDQLTL